MFRQETLNRPDCFHFPLMMTQKAFQAKFDKCDSTMANHIFFLKIVAGTNTT